MARYKVTVVRREVHVIEIDALTKIEARAIAEGYVERGEDGPGHVEVCTIDVLNADETIGEQLSHQRPGRA
jgi:hypothetical protein